MSIAIRPVTPVTNVKARPVTNTAVATAPATAAPAKPAGNGGKITGAVASAGIMTGAYAALGLFKSGPSGLIIAAIPAALAALGGWKIGAYFDRGHEAKKVTIGGVVGGALPLLGFGFGTLCFLGSGPVAVGLMIAGTLAATAGGAAIGRAADEGIQSLLKK